jgi:hypothetical protein
MTKSKITLSISAVLAATLLLPGAATALGLGGNLTYSYRTGTWAAEDSLIANVNYANLNFSSNDLGVGLTLDTAVARDRLFNYRLNINYQHAWFDPSSPDLPTINEFEYDGFEIDNVFGFGVMRRKGLRWWLGPGIRLAAGRALLRAGGGASVQSLPQFDVGAGIVTGVNLHWGKHFSLGATLGYYINYSGLLIRTQQTEIQYFGATHRISVGLTVLYRFNRDVLH